MRRQALLLCERCLHAAPLEAAAADLHLIGFTAHRPQGCVRRLRHVGELGAKRPRRLAVLDVRDVEPARSALPALLARIQKASSALLFLVDRREAPKQTCRADGEVRSLVLSGDLLGPALCEDAGADRGFCYAAADHVLRSPPPGLHLEAVQIPCAGSEPPAPSRSSTWIIPHRGPLALLEACLRQVEQVDRGTATMTVDVCFDEAVDEDHRALMRRHAAHRYSCISPPGIGPCLPRHVLGFESQSDVLVCQDSDDLPCRNRLARLEQCLVEARADMVGSHELRLDEQTARVLAVRFPLDVNAALAEGPTHALLDPTAMLLPDALRRVGGYTTMVPFLWDVQFLLRAHFSLRIRNADDFLYVRRRRAGTLSTNPRTGEGSPPWFWLRDVWYRDFERVRRGERAVEDTGLRPFHGRELNERRLLRLRPDANGLA